MGGEATRTDIICDSIVPQDFGSEREYTCTVGIEFYDAPGTWRATVSVDDSTAATGFDNSVTFTLAATSAISINPSSLTWPTVGQASTDILSNNDPITITNEGNTDGSSPSIGVTAYDIPGLSAATEFLLASDFTVDETDSCNIGNAMINSNAVGIDSTTLLRGSQAAPTSTEDVFFCLEQSM